MCQEVVKHFAIEVANSFGDHLHAVVVFDFGSVVLANSLAQGIVVQQCGDMQRQFTDLSRFEQESILSVPNQIRKPADISTNNRKSTGHCLKHAQRQAFGVGWKHQQIRTRKQAQFLCLRPPPGKLEEVLDTSLLTAGLNLVYLAIPGHCDVRFQSLGLKPDRKSTCLNSSHIPLSRMPSSAC